MKVKAKAEIKAKAEARARAKARAKEVEEEKKKSLPLRAISSLIIAVSFFKIFFADKDGAERWFELVFAVLFLLSLLFVLFDVLRVLRTLRYEDVEPMREISGDRREQNKKQLRDSLWSAAGFAVTGLLAFFQFSGGHLF